eukprot:5262688-Pyramimonas_sp.AAC.1
MPPSLSRSPPERCPIRGRPDSGARACSWGTTASRAMPIRVGAGGREKRLDSMVGHEANDAAFGDGAP